MIIVVRCEYIAHPSNTYVIYTYDSDLYICITCETNSITTPLYFFVMNKQYYQDNINQESTAQSYCWYNDKEVMGCPVTLQEVYKTKISSPIFWVCLYRVYTSYTVQFLWSNEFQSLFSKKKEEV